MSGSHNYNKDSMRRFIVDTIATIIFFTLIATLTELFIAGMEPSEVLKTRLIMIPMMVITGGPMASGGTGSSKRLSPRFRGVRLSSMG